MMLPHKRRRANQSGFTLIEVLVVVGIITVLALVLVGAVLMYVGRGAESQARNFVNNIVPEAIARWQQETGRANNQFPPSPRMRAGGTYWEGNVELYNALVTEPIDAGQAAYVGKDHFTLGTSGDGRPMFLDPWDRPYIYRNYSTPRTRSGGGADGYQGRRISPGTYDLISMGPDGLYETDDDIMKGG